MGFLFCAGRSRWHSRSGFFCAGRKWKIGLLLCWEKVEDREIEEVVVVVVTEGVKTQHPPQTIRGRRYR